MGIVARQSVLVTLTSYVGALLGYVNVLFFFPKILDADQLGLYRTVLYGAITLAPIAKLGTMAVMARHYPHYIQNRSHFAQFSGFVALLALAGVALFTGLFVLCYDPLFGFFEQNAAAIRQYDTYIVLLVAIMVFCGYMEALHRSRLRVFLPNFLRDILLKLGAFATILIYQAGYIHFEALVGSLLVFYSLSGLILWAVLVRQKALTLAWPRAAVISRQQGLDMARFGIYAFMGGGVLIMVNNLDSIMVSAYMGFEEVAVYSTTAMMTMVIDMPRKGIAQVNIPLLAEAFQKNDLNRVRTLYESTANTLLVVGILVYIGIGANLHNIYQLMPKSDLYSQGYWVFILVGIVRILDMTLANTNGILQFSQYYRFSFITMVLLLIITVGSNALLIPGYGLAGAAWATVGSLVIFSLIKVIFIYWKLRLFPYSGTTLKALALGGLAALAGFGMPYLGGLWVDTLVRSAVIVLLFLPTVLLLHISPQLNALVAQAWNMITRKK